MRKQWQGISLSDIKGQFIGSEIVLSLYSYKIFYTDFVYKFDVIRIKK